MFWRRVLFLALMVVFFVSAVEAWAADIVGQYTLRGSNPGSKGQYTGTAMVERKGETYSVGWKIGNQQLLGTGILKDTSFAVVYTARNSKKAPGLILYEILPDGSLVGKFTSLGGTALGGEIWTPIAK
uniref:Uncharacterized protein n=1 Tax=Desulfovibrio sp. U5L TaxID=596152 RepID=I2Q7Q3_9BACT